MARKVITVLTDDLDGGKADRTVEFSLDGVAYTIDVSDENAGVLRKALDPYISAGRRIGRGPVEAARATRRPGTPGHLRNGPRAEPRHPGMGRQERLRDFRAGPHPGLGGGGVQEPLSGRDHLRARRGHAEKSAWPRSAFSTVHNFPPCVSDAAGLITPRSSRRGAGGPRRADPRAGRTPGAGGRGSGRGLGASSAVRNRPPRPAGRSSGTPSTIRPVHATSLRYSRHTRSTGRPRTSHSASSSPGGQGGTACGGGEAPADLSAAPPSRGGGPAPAAPNRGRRPASAARPRRARRSCAPAPGGTSRGSRAAVRAGR